MLHISFKELKWIIAKDPKNVHGKYRMLYTHKASTFVFEQTERFKNGTYVIKIIDDNLHSIIFKDKVYEVCNLISCTCSFYC